MAIFSQSPFTLTTHSSIGTTSSKDPRCVDNGGVFGGLLANIAAVYTFSAHDTFATCDGAEHCAIIGRIRCIVTCVCVTPFSDRVEHGWAPLLTLFLRCVLNCTGLVDVPAFLGLCGCVPVLLYRSSRAHIRTWNIRSYACTHVCVKPNNMWHLD